MFKARSNQENTSQSILQAQVKILYLERYFAYSDGQVLSKM